MHNYRYLINVLLECLRACEHASAMVMEEENVYPYRQSMKVTRECADICTLTIRLLERDSMFTSDVLDICIKASRLCAEECGKFSEINYLRECADACHKAEKACSMEVK